MSTLMRRTKNFLYQPVERTATACLVYYKTTIAYLRYVISMLLITSITTSNGMISYTINIY